MKSKDRAFEFLKDRYIDLIGQMILEASVRNITYFKMVIDQSHDYKDCALLGNEIDKHFKIYSKDKVKTSTHVTTEDNGEKLCFKIEVEYKHLKEGK